MLKKLSKRYKILFFYLDLIASFKSNSINLIKLIFLNAAISGTKESFVIPGWVLSSKNKILFLKNLKSDLVTPLQPKFYEL